MTSRALLSLGVLVLGYGCSLGTEPSARWSVQLLEQRYTFGPCAARWSPNVPPVRRTVVDVYFFGNGDTPPTDAQMELVVRAGGRNVHRFNLPVVRADLDIGAVQRLVGPWPRGPASHALTVVDTTRRDVSLIVRLTGAVTDADVAAVEALGGRVRHRLEIINGYSVDIDDRTVPEVRALARVQTVHNNGIGCLA